MVTARPGLSTYLNLPVHSTQVLELHHKHVPPTMSDLTGFIFSLIEQVPVLDLDYTPLWGRGNPSQYIDNVTFKKVLTTKKWMYRIVKGGDDLGVQAGYTVESDGAHRVNFLAYNAGHGIMDTLSILVYVVDPDNGNQFLVAKWNPN